ncbi:AAA family ATPase [Vibrio alginolyticus]|uniref:AAA family ATPase n=1 Tax=Vibrio alginolyticus TaxID=663 RepID=UPI00375471AB
MKSLKIEGLRSLQNSGYIDIKPITLLLGENSSGKSTFLRTFPLLRQSTESTTRGPVLWYGSYVDFGSFDDALSHFSDDKTISFSFEIEANSIKDSTPRQYYTSAGLNNGTLEVKLTLSNDTKAGHARVQKVRLNHNENTAELEFNRNNKLLKVMANGIDLSEYFQSATLEPERSSFTLIPHMTFSTSNSFYQRLNEFRNPALDLHLESLIEPFAHGRSNLEDLTRKLYRVPTKKGANFIRDFQNVSNTNTWIKRTKCLTPDSDELKPIHAALFASRIPWIIIILNVYLSSEFSNINYVAPLRATAERYYRNQELSVEEVDFQGKNLVMFINNLSDAKKKEYKSWLNSNFGFAIDAVSDGGHLTLRITYDEGVQSYNVTDMGFGFSQILPIITQLWFTGIKENNNFRAMNGFSHPNRYLVIEQPELHLHPRFQAKMIDVFIKMVNLLKNEGKGKQIRIIMETHSETIINQIGMRIRSEETERRYAESKDKRSSESLNDSEKAESSSSQHHTAPEFLNTISSDDVSIVLFDKLSPNSPTEVSFSSYDSDGNLKDWPWGFFEPGFDL